jgi:hypothetical protein
MSAAQDTTACRRKPIPFPHHFAMMGVVEIRL